MSRMPEGERPEDEISRFHEALIQLLEECSDMYHYNGEDHAILTRRFVELTKGNTRETKFGIYSTFPCITDHKGGKFPEDSRVCLGFFSDPVYLVVDRGNAVLHDYRQERVRNADYNLLRYYTDCVRSAIKPRSEGFAPPFSDS